ncbi:tyrosine-type recombinase/integrase [Parahaliea maris]|nr:tyrosine-type recombinase/integrase [Parahaliea maris]
MDIHIAKVRDTLPQRSAPYWRVIKKGCAVGLRRNRTGEDTWVGRYRLDGVKQFAKFGRVSVTTWEQALKQAQKWFAECEAGQKTSYVTVTEACRLYVENRRVEKGDSTADDAERRFKAQVYDHPIGKKQLRKLSTTDVEKWRNGMATKSTKCAANRNLRSFKAAMNYARRQGLASTDDAWGLVGMFPGADGRRELYLSPAERRELIDGAYSWLAAFLTGLAHTGARPGELRQATVGDLDLKARTLKLSTRKGNGGTLRVRHFPLSNPQAYAFFKQQASGKLPSAPLFPTAAGGFIAEAVLSSSIRKVRRKLALPKGVVAYCFRHAAISDWVTAGIPVAAVARMCGTSIERINQNYFHLIEGSVDDKLAEVALL